MEAKIAIIIPIKGKAEYLDKMLESILNLDYPYFEVLIIDDGLCKETKIKLNDYLPKIKILESNGRGPSYARNLGIKNTCAEFVAFVDSDCIVDKNWLKELKSCFDNFSEIVGCGGVQKLPQDATLFEKRVFLFMKKASFFSDYARFGNKVLEVNHIPSYNAMYKREILIEEGGFLEGLWPGEDVELDYRLRKKGYKLLFNPKAIVYHYKPKDLKSFIKMMIRYGKAQGFLTRRYGIIRKIQLLPIINILISIFFVILFLLNKNFFFILLILGFIFLWVYWSNFFVFLLFIIAFIFWNLGFLKGFF